MVGALLSKITTAQTGQEGDKQWLLLYVTLLLHVLAVPRDAHDLLDYPPSQRLFRCPLKQVI